jgi:hypothetical protein
MLPHIIVRRSVLATPSTSKQANFRDRNLDGQTLVNCALWQDTAIDTNSGTRS